MKESIKLAVFILFWLMCGALLCYILTKCGGTPNDKRLFEEEVKRDTVVVHDTIVEIEPIPVSIVTTEKVTKKLPVVKPDTVFLHCLDFDTPRDSVEVQIPITQAEYKSEDYHAWVSGFEARLDSIRIFGAKEIITIEKIIEPTKRKEKRWHIGPMIGGGITPRGMEPYIGIGITYSLIGF